MSISYRTVACCDEPGCTAEHVIGEGQFPNGWFHRGPHSWCPLHAAPHLAAARARRRRRVKKSKKSAELSHAGGAA